MIITPLQHQVTSEDIPRPHPVSVKRKRLISTDINIAKRRKVSLEEQLSSTKSTEYDRYYITFIFYL